MTANRRRDMSLQILFRSVLGVLLELIGDIFMDGISAATWYEIVAHYAGFQCALVSIKCCSPRILRVGRVTPSAMLPDNLEIVIIEHGCLGIGNIGFALF